MGSLTSEDYHIGWICALHKEMTAAIAMLDDRYEMVDQDTQDHNSYALGRIHKHNVVIGCLPAGVDGIAAATTVAKDMMRTFTAIRICLMVGIGGGIPCIPDTDIRLGDVAVSQPQGIFGGVEQYDKGKAETRGEFVRKGHLNQPPFVLLTALSHLKAEHDMNDSRMAEYLDEMFTKYPKMSKTGYAFPSAPDCLCCTLCGHSIDDPTGDCAQVHGNRPQRDDRHPVIHYGTILSGNTVIKDAIVRDRLQKQFGAICVETEAAGLMNNFPCLVIRGICDYADLHKNDTWHSYSAAVAAAYSKELLLYVSPARASQERPIQQVTGMLDGLYHTSKDQLVVSQHQLQAIETHVHQYQAQYESDKHARCHQALKTSVYEEQKDVNPDRIANTCQWVIGHAMYRRWFESHHDDLLWISADPGCGKSVLAKSLIDHELQSTETHTVCYFFFKDNEEQDSVATALCAILHQLFSRRAQLIRHAIPSWDRVGRMLQSDTSELWHIWLAATSDPEAGNVTCVLDALDECKVLERHNLIHHLTDFYGKISPSSSTSHCGRLKFLITSRPDDEILRVFHNISPSLPTIHLRGEDENDNISTEIDLVIKAQVAKLARDLNLSSQIKEQIETKLLCMKHRTYLWLHLTAEEIYQVYRTRLRPGHEIIPLIPSNVEHAYENILGRIREGDIFIAKKALQVIVGSRRPLTIEEMAIALGAATSNARQLAQIRLDPNDLGDKIRQLCNLFVYINHSRFFLIHQTAKEFLLRPQHGIAPSTGWKHCFQPFEVEREMAQLSIRILRLEEIGLIAEDDFKFRCITPVIVNENDPVETLLVYCAEHWPKHFRDAHLATNDSLMSSVQELYDTRSLTFKLWFSVFWKACYTFNRVPHVNPLQLAAILRHENVLEILLQSSRADIEDCDWEGHTALIWASKFNHRKIVQMLLRAGVSVEAQKMSALQHAAENGHEEVVEMLLKAGAPVDTGGKYRPKPLHSAIRAGHVNVVKILLAAGADMSTSSGLHGSALHLACWEKQEEIIRLLLDTGANINLRNGGGCTPLYEVSELGYLKILQILLNAGAEINAICNFNRTALHAAVKGEGIEVAEILLRNGADITAVDGFGLTALDWAALDSKWLYLLTNWHSILGSGLEMDRDRILKASIQRLSNALLASNDRTIRPGFDELGHCLLFIGSLGMACTAFEQAVHRIGGYGTLHHSVGCKSCRGNIVGCRHICRRCHANLCNKCVGNHQSSERFRACKGSAFLDVDGSSTKYEEKLRMTSRGNEVIAEITDVTRKWLQDLTIEASEARHAVVRWHNILPRQK